MRASTIGPVLLLTCVVALGCGGGGGGGSGADGGGDTDGAAQADAAPDGLVQLIARDWSIPAGEERYRCTRVTVEQDIYVTQFRALSPLGTHHTVLSVSDSQIAPDGDYDCFAGSISHSMLFASGVGSDDLVFPDGVAIKISAGQQLSLNLHVYNLGTDTLSGSSGTLIRTVPAAEVAQEAEVVFGGREFFALPNNPTQDQVIDGGCAFTGDATVIALWPHMHQIGRRMQVVHETGQGDVPIFDEPFDFNEQVNYVLDQPIEVAAGERLDIDCIYRNDTGGTITWGDSSEQEMCYLGIYRYPATGASTFSCVER